MIVEKMQMQQYIGVHPIISRGERRRACYISLLKYVCELSFEMGKWETSMLNFLKEELIGKNNELYDVSINGNGVITYRRGKNKLQQKYVDRSDRYLLLLDCLFIGAFNDREKGKNILRNLCDVFPRSIMELDIIYNLFYDCEMDVVEKTIPAMKEIFLVVKNNRDYLMRPEKHILVTANMSAGKSTLLNALVGKKINKTQSCACTAKIHYLYNKAGEDGYTSELDYDLELNATSEILMEDNENNNLSQIIVGTRFKSIAPVDKRVCFIDTPGVNYSLDINHKKITEEIISTENFDLLICLLNANNIGTRDDIEHMKYIFNNYTGETIFIVNKLDTFVEGRDSTVETLESVRKDLENIGYVTPKVYPLSAYAAYLAKMALQGQMLDEEQLLELNLMKMKLSREESMYGNYYENEIDYIDEDNELELLLRNSGILSLEKIIYGGKI